MSKINNQKFNPLVSVIIPVYNGSDYLREAIDSALAQTHKNIEVIVVNDGSIDNTEKIALSYGNKIRYFAKENGGVASALNLALREMKGEYFSWLSHDDMYYPNKIERQLLFLSKLQNKTAILYSDNDFIDNKSEIIRTAIFDHKMLQAKPEYALFRGIVNGCTLLIPKKAFDDYGFFDEKLRCTQDYAKWFEMMKSYVFVHMSEVLVKYRLHDLQGTNKNPLVVSEGNELWIDMMKKLSIEDKMRLEGSEYSFYKEMEKFLQGTPYEKATQFSNAMIREVIQRHKEGRLSISLISHSSGKGGAERAMLDMIDVLLKNGVFVHVVLPNNGPLEQELIDRNVIYDKVDIQWWANIENGGSNAREMINNNAMELAAIIGKINPDIVYTITSVISVGAIAAKILGIPHVWNIAEFGREEHGIKYLLDDSERFEFIDKHSDMIFFVSEAVKKHYADRINIESKSFVFSPIINNNFDKENDIDNHRYYQEDVFKIAIIGSVTPGKGQKDAIMAIGEIVKGNNKIELVIAGSTGDEKYYNELQNIIKNNGIEKNVNFIGYIDDVSQLIIQSDIILVCSIFEGFGRVTIEAMLQQRPVIGANSGATPELIEDGENGFLYESENYNELAEKIKYFINNNDAISKFGKKGYNFAKIKFDKDVFSGKLLDKLYSLKGKCDSISREVFIGILDELVLKNKRIQRLEHENRINIEDIKRKKDEIMLMKLSVFWKLRAMYMKIKKIVKK